MSFLALQSLEKTYPDGTRAVKGIELVIEPGEFVVLLGPSGCGKTTTLRMIAGLEVPSAGQILMAGRDVTRLRPSQRDVGFVFQFYGLYPHMTVEENIAFPLRSAGLGRAERDRVLARVMDRLGLTQLRRRYPRQLSGGDQQRVALGRAMVRTPGVYLMDEPLGTLDADQRVRMREFIRAQQLELKVTTVYVTHDQEEAMNLADRVVVMDGGRICQAGPPHAVYDDPASLFVAGFVGSPGMNFIAGKICGAPGHTHFIPESHPATIPLAGHVAPRDAVLGIRSEHVHPDPAGPVIGRVLVDEYLGAYRSVHVDAGFGRLIMRAAPNDEWRVGDRIRLAFDLARVRLFDPHTGERL
jgi:multiple sugar transport system ATP-binding protein